MDNDEFKKRFLSFHSLIYRISYSILENREDAGDASQEVYIKLWEKRHKLGSINNDEAFVVTMAKNVSIDLLRKNHRHTATLLENKDFPMENADEERMYAREELSNVMKCMCCLPQKQQQAVRLRHFADMSIPEIAEATQQTETNVRQLLSRARQAIKQQVNRNEK